MKNKNIIQSWLPIGDFPVCSITIIKTLLLLACLSYLATAFKKLPTRFKSRSFTTTMGCTESKPEVVDTSIETCYLMPDIALRTAIEEGKVDWTEKLHKFSTDALDATGAEINMIGKPKEFRNVISWTPKACEIALNAGEVSKIPVRGVVLICHGILAHGNSHAREAVEFARAGYAVYSLDYYGHGLSSGEKGFIDSWERLVEDFETFSQSMLAKHSTTTPVILLGHSLGSIVACNVASNGLLGEQLKAIIFSGCPFKAGPGTASLFGLGCLYPVSQLSFVTKIGGVMASIDPRGPTAPLYIDAVTSDEEEQKACKNDPRRLDMWLINITSTRLLQFIEHTRDDGIVEKITKPCLLHHGRDDTIALPVGSEQLFEKLGTSAESKTLSIRDNMRHEYNTEKVAMREDVIKSFVDYANTHCPELDPTWTDRTSTAASAAVSDTQKGKGKGALALVAAGIETEEGDGDADADFENVRLSVMGIEGLARQLLPM